MLAAGGKPARAGDGVMARVIPFAQKSHGPRMPAVFFGHGSPTIALENNATTETWSDIVESFPKPRAILCVSAHWLTRGTAVTAMRRPRTIHDVGGFPDALYDVRYPAPGNPALAQRVQALLSPLAVRLDEEWGLDHGVWSVLMKAYPAADIPVVQLSLDIGKSPAEHFRAGQMLRPLRDEGVLIVGTGNVVHNPGLSDWNSVAPPYEWAVRFNEFVRRSILRNEQEKLIDYAALGRDARLAVPNPNHFWPLLYAMGARCDSDRASFGPNHIEYRSLSMMTVVLESAAHAA
jgi:4,5-DOPA dioxygenase extradiol